MKKIISAVLLCVLLLTLCACSVRKTDKQSANTTAATERFPTDEEGNPQVPSDAKISPEKAQEIAREALGITEEQMLSPFIHIGTYGENEESCYSVQFATLDYDYEFVVSAITGEILYRSDAIEETTGGTDNG